MTNVDIFDPNGGVHRTIRNVLLIVCAILVSGVVAGCGRGRHERAKTPEEFRQKFDKATQRALDKMDATEEQKAKLKPIADDLATALYGFREEHKAILKRFSKVFEAAKVDPGEIEGIRADALALADRASRKMTETIVKTSDILTPEQRRKISERWKKCM
jgi:Spy/CpxP family protein refolding chaperone